MTSGAPTPIRRRLTGVLFVGVGLGRTGYIAAVTVTTLVAKDMLGSARLAGIPPAAAVLASALGGARLAAVMDRHGRRIGLAIGYAVQIAGAASAAVATAIGSFPLLVASLAIFGFGASANNLARYAAADIHPPARRSSAIAVIVWAGTIGAVVGPSLLSPAKALARGLSIEELAGGFLVAAGAAAIALLVITSLLRPDPLDFAEPSTTRGPKPARRARWSPTVRFAVTALAIGQVVMVLIMTMTPIHVDDHGHGLGAVGMIISAHTFGMFAISPLTGLVADRIGRLPVVIVGHLVLAGSGILAAVADPNATGVLTIALFLLGVGWNFSFVAGSALLTEGAEPAVRVRLQGIGDAVIWTSGALASLSSGFIVSATSYVALCAVGASLTVLPLALSLRRRHLEIGTPA